MKFRRVALGSVDSTNVEAWRRCDAGEPGGLVVTADEQTAGRGRRGRSWVSPRGHGLYASVLLRPGRVEGGGMLFGLAAAIGVAEAIEDVGAPRATVKWPNDVEIAGLKIAGVLAEGRDVGSADAAHVIGVGINVGQRAEDFPAEVRGRATSMRQASGRVCDREELLAALLRRLEPWLTLVRDGRTAELDGPFARRDALAGLRVRLFVADELVEGIVESISPRDGLRLRLDSGSVRQIPPETASEIRRTDDGSVMSR